MTAISKQRAFVFAFDVKNGNPNGDPDAANAPRMVLDKNTGLVSDVCIKAKVRRYIEAAFKNVPGMDVWVKSKHILNDAIDVAVAEGLTESNAQKILCDRFYDVRANGGVLSTGGNTKKKREKACKNGEAASSKENIRAGCVRGPIQIGWSESINPINPHEHKITRCAFTDKKEEASKSGGGDGEESAKTMFGNKHTIPYALYMGYGFLNKCDAVKSGFTEEDFQIFLDAIRMMFDGDRSASRGLMVLRKLIVMEYDNNVSSSDDVETVLTYTKKPGVETAYSYKDYDMNLVRDPIRPGMTIKEIV